MAGVDFNRYAYAGNDPVNYSDANGHLSTSWKNASGGTSKGNWTSSNSGSNGNGGVYHYSNIFGSFDVIRNAQGQQMRVGDLLSGGLSASALGKFKPLMDAGYFAAPGFCCGALSYVLNRLNSAINSLPSGYEYASFVFKNSFNGKPKYGYSDIYTSHSSGGVSPGGIQKSYNSKPPGSDAVGFYHNHPGNDSQLRSQNISVNGLSFPDIRLLQGFAALGRYHLGGLTAYLGLPNGTFSTWKRSDGGFGDYDCVSNCYGAVYP